MAVMDSTRALAQRLGTQRLSSAPLARAADVVRLLTCVQSQERDHAFFSLAMRSRKDRYAAVQREFDTGAFVRTHILRPTWHFVAPEDLRWILDLTSPRVLSSMAARHRQLGLDDNTRLDDGLELLANLLQDKHFLTRPELGEAFVERGSPIKPGEQLGHLLIVAEMRGLVCSGPMKGAHHSYALVDEVIPPTPERSLDEAVVELVRRFFTGHGPASVKDFTRWATMTMADTKAALAQLGDELEEVEVDGIPHWFDPTQVRRRSPVAPAAYLFPTYDEAVLTYPRVNFPALPDHPYAEHTDPFWASIVLDGTNVGLWKRTVRPDVVEVEVRLAPAVAAEGREQVRVAAQRLAGFLERDLSLVENEGRPHLWGGALGHPSRRPRRADR
ncbi:winged helix DNA-binding domain-containing protein [Pedococcus bigeumensis]|uniref:Winged helix DNA-binding domain-containing protein n=1 Tax=Pedococcus bigeumensis TaxID=433644 RepID=A0A502CIZ5_9MICO|nr:winged helix DNA-binding domain-containing protein [Pedococcus bigeumensis]TPG12918.1 winged helix DNA-binding domain-containing protein [Pedococcus bigeumensis]